jgi:exodeoxyribonuclease V beta subunit
MNRTFDVADRHLQLDQNYLLEASAGTGKTFSIENIVVRFLIDTEPLSLEQILVVTFTRAATRDLKMRIRNHIIKSIDCLESDKEDAPDYLKQLIEEGAEKKTRAKKLLRQALLNFDQAQIFTIHSFCHKILSEFALEGDFSLGAPSIEQGIPSSKQLQIIQDFLRTELTEARYRKLQIKILLNFYGQNIDNLLRDVLDDIFKGEICKPSSFSELFNSFKKEMAALKSLIKCDATKILADYEALSRACNMRGKQRDDSALGRFALYCELLEWSESDFNYLIEEGSEFFSNKWPNEELLKKGQTLPNLHCPKFADGFRKKILPIIALAANPRAVFAQLAYDCQQHMLTYVEENELYNFDDILKAMQKGVKQAPFVQQVRGRYKAAIIDEFQDTDPIQWDIFKTLFLEGEVNKHRLYLVGDPKQSIYAFRRADIYTYLSASHVIGDRGKASLSTNYRSQPALVQALNALFDAKQVPGFISLPRLQSQLVYQPVLAGGKTANRVFDDDRGSLHFFTVDADPKDKLESIE